MKVRLHRYKKYKQTECSIYIVIEDEVLDLCAGLARYARIVYITGLLSSIYALELVPGKPRRLMKSRPL